MGNAIYGYDRPVEHVDDEQPQKVVAAQQTPIAPAVADPNCEATAVNDNGTVSIKIRIRTGDSGATTAIVTEFPFYVPAYTDASAEASVDHCRALRKSIPGCKTWGELFEIVDRLQSNFTMPAGDETHLHADSVDVGVEHFQTVRTAMISAVDLVRATIRKTHGA